MLKVKFRRIKNVVLMEVLEQTDINIKNEFLFCASNGIQIYSRRIPELTETTIFIRGVDENFNNHVSAVTLDNEKKAKKFLMDHVRAIQEFKEFLKGTYSTSTKDGDEEEIIIGGWIC